MEAITKKTVKVEFEGKKYALQDDTTIGMLLIQLGLEENTPVRLQITKEGFVLFPQV